MLMLTNNNAMKLMTEFEKAGGGGGDQKRFLELPRAEARQLKMTLYILCLSTESKRAWVVKEAQNSVNDVHTAMKPRFQTIKYLISPVLMRSLKCC